MWAEKVGEREAGRVSPQSRAGQGSTVMGQPGRDRQLLQGCRGTGWGLSTPTRYSLTSTEDPVTSKMARPAPSALDPYMPCS